MWFEIIRESRTTHSHAHARMHALAQGGGVGWGELYFVFIFCHESIDVVFCAFTLKMYKCFMVCVCDTRVGIQLALKPIRDHFLKFECHNVTTLLSLHNLSTAPLSVLEGQWENIF